MHVTRSVFWLEVRALRIRCVRALRSHSAAQKEHIDYMSTQALLFQHVGLSFYQQTKMFNAYRKRITD